MKKQAVLTAVASLLTLASVAVVPAFAQDTGGRTYNPMPRGEYSSYRGDHERHQGKSEWHGRGGYGYDRSDKDMHGKEKSKGYGSYGYNNSGSGSGYGYDRSDKDMHGKEKSKGYGSYGYNNSGSGSGYGYGYGSPRMSR
jgi:hypothetical protein